MDPDYSTLTSQQAPWIEEPSARAVCSAIAAGGHDIFYVGGCVRNALMGAPISDVDMATSAPPDEVIALATAAGLKPVPTGAEHGTITVVSGGIGYEVTTFRRDVQTDGRHAVVAFSTDITEDARRRDFTMNALYASPQGAVLDPLGGLQDLISGRVRFIEDAAQRIREDYLRVLRYFRFHAWYGNPEEGMDPEALAAIGSNLSGLETLSAERVGAEMRKLLCAEDPATSLAAMAQAGVLTVILPGADIRFVQLMIHGAQHLGDRPSWLGRLVALGGQDVPSRLRLSRVEQREYDVIRSAAYEGKSLLETAFDHGDRIAVQAYLIRCALAEGLPEADMKLKLKQAAAQVFPVKAADLMPDLTGAALGVRLKQLKLAWLESEFSLSRAQLLAIPAR